MHFHIVLTTRCNLECTYCHGKSCEEMDTDWDWEGNIDYDVPVQPTWSVFDLKKFIEKDPNAWISFYGGEPTLRPDLMREIMDSVWCRGFLMQTNGMFLHKLEPEYVNRFDTILVSIDGGRETTDRNRGDGVYDTVMAQCRNLIANGYKGELIARMVIADGMDVEKEVRHLAENRDFPFSSIHWQLDANFWKSDFAKRDFLGWVHSSYNIGIGRLVDWWVRKMCEGRALRLYPFLGITEDLLNGKTTPGIRCGAGWSNYTVLTDGNIAPCPVMQGMKDFYVGHIRDADPSNLPKVGLSEPCASCGMLGDCGGRCLYANQTKLWGDDGFRQVCLTVDFLVRTLKEKLPEIRKLIDCGAIHLRDFWHHRYNGCEIIP